MSKVSSMEYMVLSDLVYLNFDEKRDGGSKTLYKIFYDKEYKAIRYTAPIRDLFPRLLQKVGYLRHY